MRSVFHYKVCLFCPGLFLADCCGGWGEETGGRLPTAPAAGMRSAGDDSQHGTCTGPRPETWHPATTGHDNRFSCVWLQKIEYKYKLSFVSDKYWQIASLAWWASADRLWPYLSLDISYWQDGPRRIGWVFAPRCEIWLRILVVGRRWRVVHIVITNQERVVSVINLRRLVSCGHVKSENQWKDAGTREVAPVKNKIKRSINFM